jgi:hypothetical protein
MLSLCLTNWIVVKSDKSNVPAVRSSSKRDSSLRLRMSLETKIEVSLKRSEVSVDMEVRYVMA